MDVSYYSYLEDELEYANDGHEHGKYDEDCRRHFLPREMVAFGDEIEADRGEDEGQGNRHDYALKIAIFCISSDKKMKVSYILFYRVSRDSSEAVKVHRDSGRYSDQCESDDAMDQGTLKGI